MKPMKLWLDDVREAPPGWARAHSVEEAQALILEAGLRFTHASLDHDLGDFHPQGGDGWRLTRWMLETGSWPSMGLRVHSSNPVGVQAMLADVDEADPYGTAGYPGFTYGAERGRAPEGGWPSPVAAHWA